ncbi:MAG TPA: molybdopterin-dependent oxidoreductase, partial [Methylocella sp.]
MAYLPKTLAGSRLKGEVHDRTAWSAGSGGRGAGIRGRRRLDCLAAGAGSTNSGLFWLSPLLPAGTRAEAVLDTLPGKKPLIRLTSRPPNYEAPLAYLRTAITPNDEFFVRYHLADIPQIDAGTWKLSLGGEGANGDLRIGLDDLKRLAAFEVAAVCQCAGNRRGLFQPHVAGVQWGHGAIGCARWKGARLKDVLDLVGLN